ncbi:MAG TPA: carboxypeptidase regulatory-like domain-containing protein [Pyrinomonadaceae bacterium]|nr:carboxypeptidase regulatory-like domain-containing protein [Pyrinomonadaceae bacterium]
MLRRHAPLALLCLLFFHSPALAQQGHSVRGKVRDAAGNPVARAIVDLQTGNGTPVGQTVTNNEGDFHFGDLRDSTYTVSVNSPDHQPASEGVQFSQPVTDNTPGETRTVELMLAPRPSAARLRPGRVAFAQDVPPEARAAFERGAKLSGAGKPGEATAAFREAVRLFPDYFDAHFALGAELERAGDLGGAVASFESARRINPKDDAVYASFGGVMMRQRKFAVAAAAYAEAARLNARDPLHALLRGTALVEHATGLAPSAKERREALDEAERSLLRASELSGGRMPAAHQQLARVYERRGEPGRAADELEKYLRANPGAKNADAIRAAVRTLRAAAAAKP